MNKNSFTLYSVLLFGFGCLLLLMFGLFVFAGPAFASMLNTPAPTQEILGAAVNVPKPTMTPDLADTPAPIVNETPIEDDTPDLAIEVVEEDAAASDDGRWIDVNLSEQQIYAYEGDTLVNSFLVSTGLPDTPTVTGEYRIYVKVPMQDMSGPGYYLPNVPWVMFFYDEYGFHGTYWHNNFGTPMSRGCVNLTIEDAEWLYNWAAVGTWVKIHY